VESSPSPLHLLRSLYRTEGLWSLYRGGSLAAVRAFVFSGIQISAHRSLEHTWLIADHPTSSSTTTTRTLCSFKTPVLAATLATLVTHPIDTWRVRVTLGLIPSLSSGQSPASNAGTSGTKNTARVFHRHFPFRGLGMSLLAHVPYTALTLAGFDAWRARANPAWRLPWRDAAVAMGIAGGALILLYPLDTLRRRAQVGGETLRGGLEAFPLSGWTKNMPLRDVLTTGAAIRGWYRGCGVAGLRLVPHTALRFVVCELWESSRSSSTSSTSS
jgi:hypothetical protein